MSAKNGDQRQGAVALNRFLLGQDSLDDALTKMALIAVETVPGVDLASITVLQGGEAQSPAFTEKVALDLDETQYEGGDGPCLSAIRHSGVEQTATGADERWPHFHAAAGAAGITGTLSVALVVDDNRAIGGLNLYSRSTSEFSAEAMDEAVELAGEIAVAVANVLSYEQVATLAAQLEDALKSRAVIEQAKGILMAAQRCSPEAAFDILRRASQRESRKLRDIAAEIVEKAQRLR